jgi:O-antigen biosynthesis protein
VNVAVIVLAFNGADYLAGCLRSLAELPPNFQTLVVDNGSADASVAIARAAPGRVAVVENGRNLGFSGGMNRGMRLALGTERADGLELPAPDVVVLLNQDTRCLPGWGQAIVAPFDDPAVAAVGCKILADDERTIQHVGGGLEQPLARTYHIGQGERDEGQYREILDVEYATGAALALQAGALREVGLLDERFSPAYMEEVDLCFRLRRAGYRVVVNPAAAVVHYEGTSTKDVLSPTYWFNRGRLLFLVKHADLATLTGAFATAEAQFIRSTEHRFLLRALKRAYLDAILRLADWCQARLEYQGVALAAGESGELLALFARMRAICSERDTELLLKSLGFGAAP